MRNRLFVTEMLVVALVLGMTVVGCDNGSTSGFRGDTALNGTWILIDKDGNPSLFFGAKQEMILKNGNVYGNIVGDVSVRTNEGTYFTDDGKITMTTTHWRGAFAALAFELEFLFVEHEPFDIEPDRWYSTSEIKTILLASGITEEQVNQNRQFRSTYTYSVNGNKLTMTPIDGGSSSSFIYTKK